MLQKGAYSVFVWFSRNRGMISNGVSYLLMDELFWHRAGLCPPPSPLCVKQLLPRLRMGKGGLGLICALFTTAVLIASLYRSSGGLPRCVGICQPNTALFRALALAGIGKGYLQSYSCAMCQEISRALCKAVALFDRHYWESPTTYCTLPCRFSSERGWSVVGLSANICIFRCASFAVGFTFVAGLCRRDRLSAFSRRLPALCARSSSPGLPT